VLAISQRRGARAFERVITSFLAIIVVGFCFSIVISPPDVAATLAGVVPRFEGTSSVLLAASILGATIMPHAIYAHSALSRDRFGLVRAGARRRLVLRATRVDVTIALAIAGTVNLVMLLVAASTLQGVEGTDTLQGAHDAIGDAIGPVAATLFAVGLLASGLASSSVGAYAGSEIMGGLLRIRVPLLWRRVITLIPALLVLGSGIDPTWALVLSQVLLSFGIPFALIPLVALTAKREVMGDDVNRRFTTVLAVAAAVFLVVLNVALIVLTVTGA